MQGGRHCRVQRIDADVARQGVDALTAHGVALVGHGRRADLALLERLLHLLEICQQTQVIGELARGLRNAAQHGNHLIVHLAGVRLPGHRHHLVKAHRRGNILLDRPDFRAVAAEELHEGRLCARRALAAQQRQGGQAVFQLAIVHVQFIQPQRRALADRRQLGGLQMRVRQRRHVLVLIREIRQQVHHVEQLAAHDLQALAHDNHIGVVTHIAGRRAQMDDARRLRALQTVSVDVAHHVVAALLLAVLRMGFQLGNLLVGNVQPLFLFRLRQRNPQLPPGAELVVLGEDELHLLAGIAGRKWADIAVMRHNAFLRFHFKG